MLGEYGARIHGFKPARSMPTYSKLTPENVLGNHP